VAIDTLKLAKRLREAGFTEPQADALVVTVQESTSAANLATKQDIADLRSATERDVGELRPTIEEVRTRLQAELREAELRLEVKLEGLKAEILNRVFSMITGTLVVNIVAIFGAMFGVAKLLGH
jgi:hypothetical protein